MSIDEPRPAESGDVVIVDYESFVDDKPLEGGASENMEVELGKGNTVPEIELALLRTSPGDAAEAEVEFEDDAPRPDLAGKKVKYALKVKDIKQKVLPTLDDDFARSLGPDFDSLEMLINKIKEELGSYNEQQKETALRTQILDQLRDLSDFDIPKTLVSAEAREMVESFKQRMRQSGMDPEQTGLDEEKLLEGFRDQAEKKVKSGIVLGKISDMENVEVGDEDLDAELEKISGRVGQPPDAIKQIYNKNNMMPSLAAQVMEEKTLQAIKAAAIIESVDPAELAKETQKNEAEESSNNQVDA